MHKKSNERTVWLRSMMTG